MVEEFGGGGNRGLEGVSQKAVQLWRGKKCAPAGHYLIHGVQPVSSSHSRLREYQQCMSTNSQTCLNITFRPLPEFGTLRPPQS